MPANLELPPPSEMYCLCALWRLGNGTVQEIRSVLRSPRPVAYTTVLTLLDRLRKRGLVTRAQHGRIFRYRPLVDSAALRQRALGRFVDCFFGGSPEELRRFLDAAELS